MARTGFGPWKIELAKGSSSLPGWIMHIMNFRDHDNSSSRLRWWVIRVWASEVLLYLIIHKIPLLIKALLPASLTLQDRILPKAEKVSYRALLSMLLSRFLMNTLPTPDFLREGSRWDHMILIGLPFIVSKFIVSSALSAEKYISTCMGGIRAWGLADYWIDMGDYLTHFHGFH